jgi:hypothetical protein
MGKIWVWRFRLDFLCRCSSSAEVVASPGNVIEMEILGSYPRPTESEIQGVGPAICIFNKPSW